MSGSKLIEILKTLSPDEFKELEKFVASPYFASGRDLTPFLKILKSFYPDFSHKNFTPEYFYSKLYPGKKEYRKVQQTLKTLSSDLIHVCKEFFKQIEFEKDFNRGNYYLNNQLRFRKLYKEFEKEYKSSVEKQRNSDKGGINNLIERYFLSAVFRDYSLDRDDFVNSFEFTLATDENIVAAALMVSFVFEDEKNISSGYNLPLKYTLMNNVLENLNSEKLLDEMKKNNDRFYPYVLIYFMIYMMNKHTDKREYFYELKKLLTEHQSLFGQTENYVFWNILLSYCNVNKLSRDEISAIYEHILRNNIYKKSGKEDFHIMLFRNIVTEATATNKYEWLEDFIEKYSGELHKEHRENMYHFSYAHLNFAKGNFEAALDNIGKVNYVLFVFKIDIRILLLKIYFELSHFEQAFSLIDSTMHFLRNTTEFPEHHQNQYRYFIKNFKELMKLKLSGTSETDSLAFLEKKIIDDKFPMQQKWLLKKIDEIRTYSVYNSSLPRN